MSRYILLDELFQSRLRVTRSVRDRISGFYPDGRIDEGVRLRGYFRKPVSWRRVKARLRRGDKITFGRIYLPGGGIYDALICGRVTGDNVDRVLAWDRKRRGLG